MADRSMKSEGPGRGMRSTRAATRPRSETLGRVSIATPGVLPSGGSERGRHQDGHGRRKRPPCVQAGGAQQRGQGERGYDAGGDRRAVTDDQPVKAPTLARASTSPQRFGRRRVATAATANPPQRVRGQQHISQDPQ